MEYENWHKLELSADEHASVRRIVDLNKQVDGPFQEAILKVKEYANESAGKLISSRIDPLNQQAVAEIDKLVTMGSVILLLDGTFSFVITRSKQFSGAPGRYLPRWLRTDARLHFHVVLLRAGCRAVVTSIRTFIAC